jgi:hypothetical protein
MLVTQSQRYLGPTIRGEIRSTPRAAIAWSGKRNFFAPQRVVNEWLGPRENPEISTIYLIDRRLRFKASGLQCIAITKLQWAGLVVEAKAQAARLLNLHPSLTV